MPAPIHHAQVKRIDGSFHPVTIQCTGPNQFLVEWVDEEGRPRAQYFRPGPPTAFDEPGTLVYLLKHTDFGPPPR